MSNDDYPSVSSTGLSSNPQSLPLFSSMPPVHTRKNETQNTDDNEPGLAVTSTIKYYSPRPDYASRPEFAIQIENLSQSNVRRGPEDNNDTPKTAVIHAPPHFNDIIIYSQQSLGGITTPRLDAVADSERGRHHTPPIISEESEKTSNSPSSPSPLTTAIKPIKHWPERATPRAQTMRDFDDEVSEKSHLGNLEGIPEGTGPRKASLHDTATFSLTTEQLSDREAELKTLKIALAECWSLCNTLASLSYIHRQRSNFGPDMQDRAWKSCWRLCQELYTCYNKNCAYKISPILDLCRKFCQTLFESRIHEDELMDSVLRVSFELNNHLYNTHDRDLPDAFRERTLDFYITLCHRLMKQRALSTEIDALLSACWSLAEMLFCIRQSKREGGSLSEELLGSAVQACWELCDIFREGWTQRSLRDSDRRTPQPGQAISNQMEQQASQRGFSLVGEFSEHRHPETPTTIFEDAITVSPDEGPIPNIFVLGQGSSAYMSHVKWPSNSSSISTQTYSSEQTSSTNTVTIPTNDRNLSSLVTLVTKAAANSGYQRNGLQSLSSFVKSLPPDAFGSLPWQISLLENYKRLVRFDPVFQNSDPQAEASAVDISRAVQEMMQDGKLPWLHDLYRLVFGFHVEEVRNWKGSALQT
ncbi:hypothetical protein BDV26DRAFT_273947 [Aspergillus bertholletiae]|uniref:DUF7624 domain-containing protein n=1 Tax=Aspergillus bertholletiae TaxID=1226010 RepID=A0A5N7ARU4_9EURO|nr:hypothetical protein BDV26DRAFT_273947 [Aspergillus bertholletiae]